MSETIKLHPSWRAPLASEFAEPYMGELKSFLLGRARGREANFSQGRELVPRAGPDAS